MDKPSPGPSPKLSKMPVRPRLNSVFWLTLVLALTLGFLWFNQESVSRDEITYSFFREQLASNNISDVEFVDRDQVVGKFKEPPSDVTTRPAGDKGAKQVVEKKLKHDFSVVLPPLVGENLDQ